MKPSTPRAQQGRSLIGQLGLALAVAAVLVGVSLGSALSDDNQRRDRQQERNWRAHQSYQRSHQSYYRRAYQPYRYYAPPPVMYAPPPVVYAPLPSPGISLFFGFPFRIY